MLSRIIIYRSILAVALLTLPLWIVLSSAASSNDDKYLSTNDSIYSSPGYMNKDIQQARTLTDKYLANKDKADQKTEATQRDVSQKVEVQAAEKPKPQLKQKQSSRGKYNARPTGIVLSNTGAGSDAAPAYVQNSVLTYISKNGPNDDVSYQIKSANGKYQVFWRECDNNYKYSVKSQLFDEAGNAMYASPNILASGKDSASLANVVSLSDGNFGLFWQESSSRMVEGSSSYFFPRYISEYSIKYQVLDSLGKSVYSSPDTLAFGSGATLSNVTTLSSGKIAVFWSENDSSNNYSVKSSLFDSRGNKLSSSPIILSNNTKDAKISSVTSLANGNTAVFWREYDASYKCSIKSQMLDSSGNLLYPGSSILTSSNRFAELSDVKALANGSLAVFWSEADSRNIYSIKYRLLDSGSGGFSSNTNTLTNNNTSASISKVLSRGDGGMYVFWRESDASSNVLLKSQVVDSSGNALSGTLNNITSGMRSANLFDAKILDNGNLAVFWEDRDSTKFYVKAQLFGQDGRRLSSTPYTFASSGGLAVNLGNVTTFADGNMAVYWFENTSSGYKLKSTFMDSDGRLLLSSPVILADNSMYTRLLSVKVFDDNNVGVFWQEGYSNYGDWSVKSQFFDSGGKKLLAEPITFADHKYSAGITNITKLDSGEIAVIWSEYSGQASYSIKSQVLNSYGKFGSADALAAPAQLSKSPGSGAGILTNTLATPYLTNPYYARSDSSIFMPGTALLKPGIKDLATLSRELILGKRALNQDTTGDEEFAKGQKNLKDSLMESGLALTNGQASPELMEIAMRLASIMKNPTEDQKVFIDVIKALLVDTNKVEGESGFMNAQDLKKAQDDLLQVVANILLAQGVPDLLKSGDVSSVKAIFSELDATRAKIMLEYTKGTKPYYENMIKDMAKNMAMLQAKDLLNPNITKEELSKLPPSELDKILEKIKNMKDKTFEEEYLLQQEQKYRKDYLDPNKKKLETDMKNMLNSFTGRLNDVLKTTDKK